MTLHIEPHEIARMLGGEATLHRRVRSAAELRETVMSGLPRTALDRVVRRAAGEGIAAMELELAIVPRSTVRRRRGWLCIEESLRLERLARLTVLAEKVWGDDPVRVHRFLTSPHLELGGERPFDLLRSEDDVRRVVRVLAGRPPEPAAALSAGRSSRTAPRPPSPPAPPASTPAKGAPRSRGSPVS